MNNLRRISFVCVLSLAHASSFAQTPASDRAGDSLWDLWSNTSKPDTVRLTALNKFISARFLRTDPDSTLYYGGILYETAAKKGLKKHMGSALLLQGRGYGLRSELAKAIKSYQGAYDLYESIGDRRGAASALNNMALTEADQGDYPHAIEHMTASLKISEELKDSSMVARTLGNIGIFYYSQNDPVNAMDYYQRRLLIAEALGQKDILAEVLLNIGHIQAANKEYDKALANYERGLALSREIGYRANELLCLGGIGYVRYYTGDHAGSFELDRAALQVAIEIGDRAAEAAGYVTLATNGQELGDLGQALTYARRGMAIAQEGEHINSIRDAARVLYEVQKQRGQHHEALAMHELYISMNDSVQKDENKQAIMEQRFQYDYDKKEALMVAEQEKKDAVATEELRRKNVQRNAFIGGFGLMLLLAGTFLAQRNRVSKARKRSDELLLNILPAEVAEELKAKGEAEAVHIDQVTVLFTDFKGFTAMSEVLSPRDLVSDLNESFSAFDRITEKFGIEKIKTIGDAYMAAGGLPTPNTTHATDVIQAALEMRDFIAEGKAHKIAAGLPFFEIRIGVHTGPVVAGIVGVKKFSYDIWGDTVNTASRMESSGEVGQVNISEATYALVKDEPGLTFTPRGKVQAKGKGGMEMYFVERA
ncbi:MAG: adenylate/guanylate cyclase domain-containing protein [Flavobacteriales bacterium]